MQHDRPIRNKHSTNTAASLKINEDENEIALDAEIDKLLEEKAAKSNLSVINVKSVIRQVVQNQMVQRMISATVKRKERAERKKDKESPTSGVRVSSDEDGDEDELDYYEPKLTRAKTKELLENQTQPVLWPISPGKFLGVHPAPSEAQILINQQDLPEESEAEDEEYVPKESELHQSDEESISRSSFSDTGSPATPNRSNTCSFLLRSKRKRSGEDQVDSIFSQQTDISVFKTPSPRQKRGRKIDSAIGLRTRSKLPLNDTPLETLEKQFIPPDITTDMYESKPSDAENPDYLDFLKAFMSSGEPTTTTEANDDEEADPEYNVMEDEEDDHDQEEHRVDRAVKVAKKELNELVADLFDDYHFSSGDELEDILSTLEQRQEQISETSTQNQSDSTTVPVSMEPLARPFIEKSVDEASSSKMNEPLGAREMTLTTADPIPMDGNNNPTTIGPSSSNQTIYVPSEASVVSPVKAYSVVDTETPRDCLLPTIQEPLFNESTYATLQHQLQQHIQLLTQSYILSAQIEDPVFVKAAHTSKSLLLSLDCTSRGRGPTSVCSVKNLQGAIQLVTSWPPKFTSNSPIKKKILEAQGFNSLCRNKIDGISVYERDIVKLIGVNKTFMYGFLLPSQIKPNIEDLLYFTPSEDALIVCGLDTLKPYKHSLRQEADLLSKTLVSVRTAEQIFHRIRNLKKQKSFKSGANAIQNYFVSEKLPDVPVQSYLPETPLPPIEQPEYCMSDSWVSLMNQVLGATRTSLEDQLASTSLTTLADFKKRVPTKKKRKSRRKSYVNKMEVSDGDLVIGTDSPSQTSNEKRSTRRREKKETLNTTFPYMNDIVSQVDSAYEIFPINCFNGDPQFYCTVPKYVVCGQTEDRGGSTSSPIIETTSAKKTSKSNTGSDEKLLESCNHDEEVKSAYAEAYFSKVQQRIEVDAKNPVLFSTFIQTFIEFQKNCITENQFAAKVEEILKDYPDLITELWGMSQPNKGASSEQFASHEECQAQVIFLERCEKWTAKCPQLKTKILHKLKILREEPNLTEPKIVSMLQPFCSHIPNQLMMDSFRAMFPSVFRSQATSSPAVNTEEGNPHAPATDLEMMDSFEVVKLPEEKSVPATNTCPCTCHKDPTNVSFYTRAKHCNKCCLKFQDGKVFVHSGRMMKRLSGEVSNPKLAKQINAANVTCLKPTKRTSLSMSTSPSAAGCSAGKGEQGCIIEDVSPTKEVKSSTIHTPNTSDVKEAKSSTSSADSVSVKPWTMAEDRTILESCQTASDIETGFMELSNILADRSTDEIKVRFDELFSIMQQDSDASN